MKRLVNFSDKVTEGRSNVIMVEEERVEWGGWIMYRWRRYRRASVLWWKRNALNEVVGSYTGDGGRRASEDGSLELVNDVALYLFVLVFWANDIWFANRNDVALFVNF